MFSSDSKLSPEAKEVLQREVNRTGELFTNHVAQMRGISPEVVIATEAGLLFGKEAVNINFIDGIISFDDLLEDMINADFPIGPIQSERMSAMFLKDRKVSNPKANKKAEGEDISEPEVASEDAEVIEDAEDDEVESYVDELKEELEIPTEEIAIEDPVERAATISAMCTEASMSDMAPSYIRSGITIDQLKDKIEMNTQVSQACVLAGKPDRAEEFIKAGTSLSKVQSTLISELAEEQDSNEVNAHQSPDSMKADLEKAKAFGGNVILADAKRRQEIANKGAK